MNIFQFEQPIADAIKARFIKELDEKYKDSWKSNLFLSYEPPSEEIYSYTNLINVNGVRTDGAVCVYAELLNGDSGSSQTGEQSTINIINVDCYGYGDVIEKESQFQKSSITAQNRAQVLTSIAYKAIMDAQQISEDFGTGITIGEKVFVKAEKVGAIGPEQSDRTICFYRSQYKIKIEEDIPTEELGVPYDLGTAEQNTSNPE